MDKGGNGSFRQQSNQIDQSLEVGGVDFAHFLLEGVCAVRNTVENSLRSNGINEVSGGSAVGQIDSYHFVIENIFQAPGLFAQYYGEYVRADCGDGTVQVRTNETGSTQH